MQSTALTLSRLPLFTPLPADALAALADVMHPESIADGEVLFRKGDAGGAMYLIVSGVVQVVLENDQTGELQVLRQLGAGAALGDMSLIDQEPRTATVIAISPTELLTLYSQDFLDIVQALGSNILEELKDIAANLRARKIDLLKQIPLFEGLPDELLEQLATKMVADSLNDGETLFRKGDPGNAMYVITRGWVKITTVDSQGGELMLNQCGPGESIGEMSLLDEEPRSASVTAIAPAEVLELSREDLFEVLAAYPSLARHMLRKLSARMRFSTTYIEQAIDFSKRIADGDYNFVKQQIRTRQSSMLQKDDASDQARAAELLAAFFTMVEGVQKREEELQQQVRQLTIQIDQAKRQEEVETVTKSDFYADLKKQAAKLREERDADS